MTIDIAIIRKDGVSLLAQLTEKGELQTVGPSGEVTPVASVGQSLRARLKSAEDALAWLREHAYSGAEVIPIQENSE